MLVFFHFMFFFFFFSFWKLQPNIVITIVKEYNTNTSTMNLLFCSDNFFFCCLLFISFHSYFGKREREREPRVQLFYTVLIIVLMTLKMFKFNEKTTETVTRIVCLKYVFFFCSLLLPSLVKGVSFVCLSLGTIKRANKFYNNPGYRTSKRKCYKNL